MADRGSLELVVGELVGPVEAEGAGGRAEGRGTLRRLRFGLKRRFGLLDPFEILPYRGHGTTRELFLRGRVLEEAGITRAGQDDAVWKNILNMARRFASDEVAGARVRASFEGLQVETTADAEGFFEVRFQLAEPLDGPAGWYPVGLDLLSPPSPGGGGVVRRDTCSCRTGPDSE